MAQEYLPGLGPSAKQVSWASEAGSPRQSFLTWAQVYAVLLQHEQVARRPG